MKAQERLDELSNDVAAELTEVVRRFNDIRNRKDINWGDVGDMGRILDKLQELTQNK